jgi:hypothetical protein
MKNTCYIWPIHLIKDFFDQVLDQTSGQNGQMSIKMAILNGEGLVNLTIMIWHLVKWTILIWWFNLFVKLKLLT